MAGNLGWSWKHTAVWGLLTAILLIVLFDAETSSQVVSMRIVRSGVRCAIVMSTWRLACDLRDVLPRILAAIVTAGAVAAAAVAAVLDRRRV